MDHLWINNTFGPLNFECSDGCFRKSTSVAKPHVVGEDLFELIYPSLSLFQC